MAQYFILPKLLYITLYAVLGSAIPYLPLFYDESLRLSSNQIGVVLAIAPFVQSVACPVWTILADKKPSWHGPLMAILIAIGGTSVMTLMFLPNWLMRDTCANNPSCDPAVTKTDESSTGLIFAAVLALIFAFFGQPVSALVDSAVLKILGEHKVLYGSQRLWGSISNGANILLVGLLISTMGINVAFYVFGVSVVCFIIIALFTRFGGGNDSILDSTLSQINEESPLLKDQPRTTNYAIPPEQVEQNHTPVQNSFFSALSQVPTDHSRPEQHPSNYAFGPNLSRHDSVGSHTNTIYLEDGDRNMDQMMRVTTSMAAQDVQTEANELLLHTDGMPSLGLVLSRIPTVDTSLAAFASIGQPDNMPPSKSTLTSPRVWTFLVTTLLFGIAYAMIAQFLFLYLRNNLGMESALIGWTGPIGGVAEVSTFYISKQLFDNFSVTSLISFAHIVLILRNFVYTWLSPNQFSSTVIALSMQLVSGLAYAMIWSTSVSEVDTFFPADQRAMAQGILAALFSGLGYGLGCIIGGMVYDQYGVTALFEVSAAIAAFSLGVFLLGRWSHT
ncbi:major facilitator superfamily domain-containing protein [Phycomyces blakesleeanus]